MSTSSLLEHDVLYDLREIAQQLRVDSVRASDAASSGHPTSSMSAADLMAVLLARYLRYDFSDPKAPGNDHLLFSKGHASPLLYAMLRAAGAIGEEELLSYRTVGSRLEGHPTPRLPWVDDRACGEAASHDGAPTVILARTRKGRGVAAVEDQEGKHGKPLPDVNGAVRELGGVRDIRVRVTPPATTAPGAWGTTGARGAPVPAQRARPAAAWRPPAYEPGTMVATRTAFGEALVALGDIRPDVVVLDGEVSDSTRTGLFADPHPDRFFEFYIAEQQLIAAAVGMQVRGWTPFAATFAAFLSRAYDTVLCPCDANQAAWLIGLMADLTGVSYLRTSRGETPVLYEPEERFEVGGSRVPRSAPDDQVTLVAAGITVLSAVAAGGAPLPTVRKLAVRSRPASAAPEEQLQLAGIDVGSVATAAAELVAGYGVA